MDIHDSFKLFTDGQFDARKGRQALYEWNRDNLVVYKASRLAQHLGLSSEESYLLIALHLLSAYKGLMGTVLEDIRLHVPTLYAHATKDGPFITQKPSEWGQEK